MTQDDMITLIAQRCGAKRGLAADTLVDLLAAISNELAEGGRVFLPGIGALVAVATKPNTRVRDPRTGAKLPDRPAGRRLRFTATARMKARLAASPKAAE